MVIVSFFVPIIQICLFLEVIRPPKRYSTIFKPGARHALIVDRSSRLLALAHGLALAGCVESTEPIATQDAASEPTTYVGSQRCGACHAERYQEWLASDHAQAIQVASQETIAAPLPAEFEELEVRLENSAVVASIDGVSYPLPYTFGIRPLQQYLVDIGHGRLQTLRASYDTRPVKEGGQRWFHQYEGEQISEEDVLHWKSFPFNWNSSCADCHSTGFRKEYDETTDWYDSSFAELSVGCEACHGPGSRHARDPGLPLPASDRLSSPEFQPEICAPCHARRSQLVEGYTPDQSLFDHYAPALINPPLYKADGQIDDEVYVFGSFVSSRMHSAGVTCNDCHDPHRAKPRATGSDTCLTCHSPAGNPRFPQLTLRDYTDPSHHLHAADSPGSRCVSCHMPSKTYMGVDERHDHSFRIPRPDLSAQYGVPNACQQCHEQPPGELAAALSLAHGKPAESWVDQMLGGSARQLTDLAVDPAVSAMVRATALSRLASFATAGSARATQNAANQPHPLLRLTAVGNSHLLDADRQRGLLKRLLTDPVLAVRAEAAFTVLRVMPPQTHELFNPALDHALEDYVAIQSFNIESAEANVNLASVHRHQGDLVKASERLRRAMEINPQFVPALLNFADLMRLENQDDQAEAYLLRAVAIEPPLPEAHYAYAMWLVRNQRRELALIHLGTAYRADSDNPQWAYAYAVALHSMQQSDVALAFLNEVKDSAAYAPRLQFLHVAILRDTGQSGAALKLLDELIDIAPSNPNYQAMRRNLVQRTAN